MQKKMTYRIVALVLTALVGLSACRKHADETSSATRYSDIPILFDCQGAVEVATRADDDFYISNEQLITGQYFAVNAWDTGAGYLSTNPGAPAFMTQLPVQYQNNRDKGKNNTYTPVVSGVGKNMDDWMDQFWPRDGSAYRYSFCAYYPYNADADVTGISAPTFPTSTVGQYAFTAKSSVEDMVDFCVSDVANDQVYGHTTSDYAGTVKLNFHHALTRVRVKFLKASDVSDATAIELLDAQLLNVKTEGTLTATYAQYEDPSDPGVPAPGPDRVGTTSLAWSGVDTQVDYQIRVRGVDPDPDALPDPVKILLPKSMELLPDDVFLMVPQDIVEPSPGDPHDSEDPDDDAQAILFKWTIDHNYAEPKATLLYLSESVKHPGDPTPADVSWGVGDSVTYTVVIHATPIHFDDTGVEVLVSVAPWPVEDVNGYIQIID